MTENAPTTEKIKTPSATYWSEQLHFAEREHKDFFDAGVKCEKRYRNEKDSVSKNRGKRLNVFYSNTETLMASLYARAAKPDVRQRFTQNTDKLGKTTGELLERVLSASSDKTEHDRAFRSGVRDLAVVGRGVVKVCYDAKVTTGEGAQEIIADQTAYEKFVYVRDFLHSPARVWDEVWWVAFRHKMTRQDLRDNGFEDAEEVPLNWIPSGSDEKNIAEGHKRAEVWEIWDKTSKTRVWLVRGYPKPLRVDEDPYGLQGFFPMAEPVQAISANDTYVPASLLQEYQDQADDLDEINDRISKLTRALKRRGVYDQSVKELKRLAKAGDNEFIPAENFAAFAAGGGLKGAFQTEDLKPFIDVLTGLYQQKEMLVQNIYEITGISDIMRGASDASETATAQNIKAQFGSNRLKLMQREVQRWVRDTLRLKAELMAEHYEPQKLLEMSGMELPSKIDVQAQHAQAAIAAMQQGQPAPPPPNVVTIDDVVQVLRDDKLRSYRVDIETDSTVFEDLETEKAARTELLTAMGGFLQQWMPVVQMGGPPMMKLAFESLAFGVRGFKTGRHLEDALDEARAEFEQMAAQPPAPPPPDPAVEKLAMEKEMHAQKMQQENEKHQFEMQKAQQQLEMDFTSSQAKLMQDAAAKGMDPSMMLKASPKMAQANSKQMSEVLTALENIARMTTAPKRVIRDDAGRVIGIEPVVLN